MLYELRVYEAAPGKMPALHKRFAEITLGYFEKYGMEVVGFWTNEIGGFSNELNYMLRFENMADRETRWAAFIGDAERQQKFAETEVNGPLTARIRASFLRPTPYSPMK